MIIVGDKLEKEKEMQNRYDIIIKESRWKIIIGKNYEKKEDFI